MGNAAYLLYLCGVGALFYTMLHFHRWWSFIVLLGLLVLSRLVIWRNQRPPASVTKFTDVFERYLKEEHGYLRLLIFTALVVLGASFVSVAGQYLLPLRAHGWADRLTSVISLAIGLVLLYRGVAILRNRGPLRFTSQRKEKGQSS